MGKRSRKRTQWHEKSKLGCMWSWINMFDFGHGRANQKLLSDKRHNVLNVSDRDASKNKLKMLKDVEEIGQRPKGGILGGELTRDSSKLSVKRLIEEEMVNDSMKKRNKIALSGSEFGSLVKRNQKKATPKCKTSSQIYIPDTITTEILGSDDSGSDHYIEAIMQNIFNHIQPKSMSWSNIQQGDPLQSEQKLSLLEEIISEATKAIMHQKFLDGEHLTEARKVQYYKKYMDTLEMLDTNKEFFLKLSEDPNSSLMKQIKKMPTNSLSQKPYVSEEHNSDLQYTFFRRKLQLQKGDDNYSKGKNSELSNKIVILKPERTELRASAPENSTLVRYSAPSQFSLSDIRKKLRLAMQKDRRETSSSNVASMSPYKFQKLRFINNVIEKDNLGMRSPKRFYVEKIPKPSSGSNLVDKIKNKSDASAKQRVSNIYIEAKRHLSEMLSKGDEESEGLPNRHTPKTLERYLSVPECNILNCRIPGKHSFDHNTTEGRLSASSGAQPCSKNSQETESVNQVDLNDLWSSETDICVSDDNYTNVLEACNASSNNDKEPLVEDNELTTSMHSLSHISTYEGGIKVTESTDSKVEIADSAPDAICESASVVGSSVDQNTCLEDIDNTEASENIELEHCDEYSGSYHSPLVHPFYSAINIDIDDISSPAEKSEKPSPISVIEYVFSEDEFSPAGSEYSVVPRRLRPIRINFNEDEQSSTTHDAYIQGCIDNIEIAYKYVEALLSSTELCWEELYMTSLLSTQLLNEALFDEVEGLFSQLYCDERRLLFDCVNEILSRMCQRYFVGRPLISFLKINIRPLPNPQHTIQEVWEGVEWHLLPPPHLQSLEQIVQKDVERDLVWMNLCIDVEELSTDMETVILQELIQDAVLSCIEVLVR